MAESSERQGQSGSARSGQVRVPGGIFWTAVALIVLGLVYSYDHRGRQEALKRVESAHAMETAGHYTDAITEYRIALENPRLGNRDKGKVALRIADLYMEQLQDPVKASEYFSRARRQAPRLFSDSKVVARADEARRLAGAADRAETPGTVAKPPLNEATVGLEQDAAGPAVAELAGRPMHAGEIVRTMGRLPAFDVALEDRQSTSLEQLIQARLEEALALQAAIDEGLDRDPDLIAKVHDYRRSLLVDRYVSARRRQETVVTNAEVEEYFKQNRDRFSEPARVGLAVIKTETSETAALALADLRAGMSFADVASSRSVDADSRTRGGVIGLIAAGSETIQGVGPAGETLNVLMSLNPGDITGITEIAGSYYIFKVMTKHPAREASLDQVRGQIEGVLRRQKRDASGGRIVRDLEKRYDARLLPGAADALRAYVAQVGSSRDDEFTSPPLDSQTTESADGSSKE